MAGVSVRFINTEEALSDAIGAKLLEGSEYVAVDCEGKNLGRAGTLELLQIGTDKHVLLIDVPAIGKAAAQHLRPMLEDSRILKLLWDCRMDSDVLKHFLDISLKGVVDMQLADALSQEQRKPYIQQYAGLLYRVRGLKRVIDEISEKGNDERLTQLLKHKSDVAAGDVDWQERPLPQDLLDYAATDVEVLVRLASHLLPPRESDQFNELVRVSEKYSLTLASMPVQTKNSMQFSHNIIPVSVLHDQPLTGDNSTKCVGCLLTLPNEPGFRNHCVKCNGLCIACQEIMHRSRGTVTHPSPAPIARYSNSRFCNALPCGPHRFTRPNAGHHTRHRRWVQ
eukprot:TRINITY_DN3025_c0_g2_i3.p1 TRINITY_DN3025_c0_g2~~TRINITY_DN3025_c0_g2_i3.p1  ORF type:complete len:338 (+),score=105.42 TRINITY_DN3025_c0_g2_i3:129-1142(+)